MFCAQPFTSLDLLDRAYSPCCVAWLDERARITRAESDAPWDVWNHPHLVALRAAVLGGDFRFCRYCPRYVQGQVHDRRDPAFEPVMQRGPSVLNVANDRSCNLLCWSCRQQKIVQEPTDRRRRILDDFCDAFLADLRWLSVSHSGDPFACPLHRELLRSLDGQRFPDLQIRIFTNGLLLPANWESLRRIHANINSISISIDAATAGTYERLRRGGKWRDLVAALSFVARLRRAGEIEKFQGNFCVSAINYREMPAFVELMKRFGATAHFGMLRRWWQPRDEYAAVDLTDPGHPERRAFEEVLRDPRLADPVVLRGVFRPELYAMIQEHERSRP